VDKNKTGTIVSIFKLKTLESIVFFFRSVETVSRTRRSPALYRMNSSEATVGMRRFTHLLMPSFCSCVIMVIITAIRILVLKAVKVRIYPTIEQQSQYMDLSVRKFDCPCCSKRHHRDVNAAINIKNEGLRILALGTSVAALGGNVRPKQYGHKSTAVAAVAVELESPLSIA
jgi:hypothetical protein